VKLCHVCGRSVSQDPDASMTVRDDWNGFGSPPPEAILYLCGECDSEAVSPLTPLYQTPTQSPVRAALLRDIAIPGVWWRFVASFCLLGTPGGVEGFRAQKSPHSA
jgi:hypothetical protein